MVIWVIIRCIITVGTGRSRVRIFTKAITVITKVITWDMVMMIWITIRFIILIKNSGIAVRTYIKVVVVIIVIIIVSVTVILWLRLSLLLILLSIALLENLLLRDVMHCVCLDNWFNKETMKLFLFLNSSFMKRILY